MLTLTSQTIRSVSYEDDDGKWRGAARKYLATVDGKVYLVKPDYGWPSDSTRERVAAAFYRSIGIRTANVVRASVDGTPAVAVRIIPDCEAVGDNGMESLPRDAALDVVLGVMGAAMIGDNDKHEYNFITDGARAYSIDHGLSFGSVSGHIGYTGAEHLTKFVEADILTWGDIRNVIEALPDNTGMMADLAYRHATSGESPVDLAEWRTDMLASLEDVIAGVSEEDEYEEEEEEEEEEEDCDDNGWGPNGHQQFDEALPGFRTCDTRRFRRQQEGDRQAIRNDRVMRDHDVRRVHHRDCSDCRRWAGAQVCECRLCPRTDGARCATLRMMPVRRRFRD